LRLLEALIPKQIAGHTGPAITLFTSVQDVEGATSGKRRECLGIGRRVVQR
jgi:hypothetical protein